MATSTAIVAYLALFATVGFVFLFANLLVGRLVRPDSPNAEKLEIYECGEPAVGKSHGQFDLRFYVVALLFIIFDVEIAFFFPWATVYGKTTQLAASNAPIIATQEAGQAELSTFTIAKLNELGLSNTSIAPLTLKQAQKQGLAHDLPTRQRAAVQGAAKTIALASLVDILIFFAVLLVGFAYVWTRGDLDWVRNVTSSATNKRYTASGGKSHDPANAQTGSIMNNS